MRSPIILSLTLLLGCATTTQPETTTTDRARTVGCQAMGWTPISESLARTGDPVQRIMRIWENFGLRTCLNFTMGVREDVTRDLGEACRYGRLECFVACHGLSPTVRHLYVGQCQEHWDINMNLN